MKNQVEVIRYLASRELQEKYIVNGTKDEYLLPDELVADASTLIEDIRAGGRGGSLTQTQRNAIQIFASVLRANASVVYDPLSNAELVERNEQWAAIRNAAQQLLQALGENKPGGSAPAS